MADSIAPTVRRSRYGYRIPRILFISFVSLSLVAWLAILWFQHHQDSDDLVDLKVFAKLDEKIITKIVITKDNDQIIASWPINAEIDVIRIPKRFLLGNPTKVTAEFSNGHQSTGSIGGLLVPMSKNIKVEKWEMTISDDGISSSSEIDGGTILIPIDH